MKKKKTKKSRLPKAEIEKFTELLLAKRREILGNVISMEDETLRKPRSDLSNVPIHPADVGTDNYEIENTLGLMDSERKILAEINDALHRIENGTYGICEGTGEPIGKERLKAIPWTRYCVEYAGQMEKSGGKEKQDSEESDYDEQGDDEHEEDSER